MFGKKVKVITHGFFFRKNMLETRCKCGCVYLTPKEKVFIREINDYFGRDTDFETKCPECKDVNHQRRKELEKASELE